MDRLKEAREEAKRFLKRADAAIAAIEKNGRYDSDYAPHNAAAKRSSMDLTKALARVRRSPYAEDQA